MSYNTDGLIFPCTLAKNLLLPKSVKIGLNLFPCTEKQRKSACVSTRLITEELTAYRDYSVATKRKLVEILKFRHFAPHVVFDAEGDKYRNKRIENHITVSVVIDLECGNTKN